MVVYDIVRKLLKYLNKLHTKKDTHSLIDIYT